MNGLIQIKNHLTSHDLIYPEPNNLKSANNGSKIESNNEITSPFFLMTLENDKNQQKLIKIFADSDPAKLAFNFCLENQMDYETMLFLKNNIEKIVKIFKKNKKTKNPQQINELDEEYENSNINSKKEHLPYAKKSNPKNYKFDIFDYEINQFTNDNTEGEESLTERGVPVLRKSISNHFNNNINNNEMRPAKTLNISRNSDNSYNFNKSYKKDILQTYLKTLSPKLKKNFFIKKNKALIPENNKNENLKLYNNQNILKTNYIKSIPKNKETIQNSEIMQRPKVSAVFSRKASKNFNIKNNSTNHIKKTSKPKLDIFKKINSRGKITAYSCKNKSNNSLNKDYNDHIKNTNPQNWNTLLTKYGIKKLPSKKNQESYANTIDNSKKIVNNINRIEKYLKNNHTFKKIHSSYCDKNDKMNMNNRKSNNLIQKCESKYKLLTSSYPTYLNVNENSNKMNKKNKLILKNMPSVRKIKHRNVLSNDFLTNQKNLTLTDKKDTKTNNIAKVIRVSRSNNITNSTDSFFRNNNSSLFQNNTINILNKIFSLFDKEKNGIIYFNGNLYQQFGIFPNEIRNIIINLFEKLINGEKYLIKINRLDFIEKMLVYFNELSNKEKKILINSENKINDMIKTDLFEYYKPKITNNKFKKIINFN